MPPRAQTARTGTTQKLVMVHDVRSPSATEVNGEVELRAAFSIINDEVVIELEAPFKINPSMSANQREAAMIASMSNDLNSQYGITVTQQDLAWPWFR
jgi:hypothetical protein